MWDCGKNCRRKSIGFFHNCTFFFQLKIKNPIEELQSVGAFFLISGGCWCWKKSLFLWLERSRKRCRLKALAVEFFSKTEQRKAFYIIPNYRQKWFWFASSEVEGNVLRGQLRIILIMLLAAALKRGKSVGKASGKMSFFALGAGYLTKMQALGRSSSSIFLSSWMVKIYGILQ